MLELTSLVNTVTSNIALMFLKSLVNTLLTYPLNVIILSIIILTIILQSVKGCLQKNIHIKEVKSMKEEINVTKTKECIEQLKKELSEVHEDINKMGIMFGYRVQDKDKDSKNNKELKEESRSSIELKNMIERSNRNQKDNQKVSENVRNSMNSILKELLELPANLSKVYGM